LIWRRASGSGAPALDAVTSNCSSAAISDPAVALLSRLVRVAVDDEECLPEIKTGNVISESGGSHGTPSPIAVRT
jgi:hypothetical protein